MAKDLSFDDFLREQDGAAISFDDFMQESSKPVEGGFTASVKQTVGSTIKGAGQLAADYIPGVGEDNAVKRYGEEVIAANPTAVRSLEDIKDKPWTAVKEATGNAGASVAGVVGARALGMGITAASPLAGPAAPAVALAGQAIAWFGPAAIAALPSYGSIREKQQINDPESNDSWRAKAIASLGAATVGAIETKFGPQEWALSALTKEGRKALAEKFAETTAAKAIGFGALKGAAIEGAEELAQNPIEQLAGYDDPTTPESLKDTAFGGAMGALGGGVFGGGTGAMAGRGQNNVTSPTQPKPEVQDIGAAQNVDEAIAAADAVIGQSTQDALAATRAEKQRANLEAAATAETDRQAKEGDLQAFMESENRNLQVARAQILEESRKARELEQIQQAGRQDLGRTPDQQVAAAAAATDEAPTAMQLAMQRALERQAQEQANVSPATPVQTIPAEPAGRGGSDASPGVAADVGLGTVSDGAMEPGRATDQPTRTAVSPQRGTVAPELTATQPTAGTPQNVQVQTPFSNQAAAPARTAAPAEQATAVPSAGGAAANLEAVGVAEPQRDGTALIRGDVQKILAELKRQGFSAVLKRQGGVLVGRSQAPRALEVFKAPAQKVEQQAQPKPTELPAEPAMGERRLGAIREPSGKWVAVDDAGKPIPESPKFDTGPAADNWRRAAKQAAPEVKGEPIDSEWSKFTPDSGTKGVPRAEMPQIKAEHRGAMTNFLNARGIEHEQVEVPARDLKPTQAEFSPAKVEKAKAFDGGDRSILISADGHILDGHHQWLAKRDAGETVQAIRLDAPIEKLLDDVKEFPSAQTAEGATAEPDTKQAAEQNKPSIAEEAPATEQTAEESPAPAEEKPISQMSAADLLRAAADKMEGKAEKIDDLGEKIGGARKDTATSTGRAPRRSTDTDDRPTWAKRFQISQIVRAGGQIGDVRDEGRWVIRDTRSLDWRKQPKQVGRETFSSQEAAEKALPLLAVAQKHRVVSATGPNGTQTWEIWRDVSDRKRVKVINLQFGSREDAMRYMAEHATEIIEANTTFGEADLPVPENKQRIGIERRQGDVKGEDFMQAFGFRGVEFGNWNNQDDRQQLMNEAYDGLMDLAEVMDIPPKAISLNGDLALAFGARGKGLSGARAHYEQDRVVMNLTKMNGAGALAHEWFHALDHYLARQDGKTTADWKINKDGTRSLAVRGGESDMASSGFLRMNSGVREELRAAYTSLVQSLFTKAEQYVEDTDRADKFVAVARGELEKDLSDLRKDLSEQKDVRYYKRNNKPASAEQLAEFDALAAELVEGRGLSTEWKTMPGKTRMSIQARHTNDTLEKMNDLYKAVRGRSGFNAERRGVLDSLTGYMRRYDQRLQMLREATALTTKTKRVPTSFAMDAKSLDQGRGSDYWTSPHEMVARAFQGYVEDAIAAKEGRSPFLNYGPENAAILTPWGAKRPFPSGDERKAMNAEFDKFIDVLETKETEKGVAMFARGEGQLPAVITPSTVDRVQAAITELIGGKQLSSSLGRIVATTAAEIKSTWEPLIGKNVQIGSEGEAGVAQAFFEPSTKTVFMIADHINVGAETAVLAHELMHKHGQSVLGKAGWDRLHGMIGTWKDAAEDSDERFVYDYATRKVQAVGEELSTQELFPYAVEAAIRMGIKPSMQAKRGTVSNWLESVRQNLKVVWAKITGKTETFKAQDMVDLAFGIAQMENPQSAKELSGALTGEQSPELFDLRSKWEDRGLKIDIYEQRNGDLNLSRIVVPKDGRNAGLGTAAMRDIIGYSDKNNKRVVLSPSADFGGNKVRLVEFYKRLGFVENKGPNKDLEISESMYRVPAESAESKGDDVQYSRRVIVGETTRKHTPDQLRAMRNVGFEIEVPTPKERAQVLWQDAGKKLAQGIVDQFAPVKDLDKEAYGLLRLAKGASGAFEVFLRGGKLKLTDGVYDYDEQNKGGVIDKLLIPLQGEHHDFMRWIAANRAERLTAEGRENLFSAQDIADLKTLADGTTDFDYTLQTGPRAGTVTRDRTLIYADAQRVFNGFNKNVLDLAEQSGLIDGTSRHLWESEFYVPFYRVAEEDGGVRGANIKSGVVRQEAFKKLKGGSQELNADLLDNTLMNWAHLLDAAAKNRAAKATIEAAEKLGAATQVPSGTKKSVWFMDKGQKHHAVVDDPYLLTAITALEYAGMRNPVMNAMGTFKHYLTMGVTASPFFKIRNLIRDSMQVVATSGISPNVAANVGKGWALTNPQSDEYFRLMAGGGTIHFGTMLEGSEAKRVQALVESGVDDATILNDEHKVKQFYRKFIEPAVTAYNELGNRGEAINRASLYDQLRKQGISHAEASLQARDLMDFSMQGSFTTIRFLTQVVPFFNARLQGMYKLGRAANEDPKRMATVIGAVSLVSLSLLAAYGDDDDWKKREEWDRNNYWWFKFGGTAFRIPKPFEIGAMATLAERGFELLFDKEMTGKRFRKQVLTLLSDNLSMNPVPQLVKPILDVYANKDSFTGRPIETMGMDRLQSEYRFTDRTSMTARAASTAANAVTGLVGVEAPSPVQIDHMLRGYFGWLGAFVVGAGDIIARPMTGQPERPSSDIWKAATGGMISDVDSASSRYVSQMYEQSKEIERAYATWRNLVKEGKTLEAGEYLEENRDEIRNYRKASDVKAQESRLNQRIRMIERSNMEPDKKREQIRQLQDQKDRIARRLSN